MFVFIFLAPLLFDFEFCSLVELRLVLGRQSRVKHARGVAADQFAIFQEHPIGHVLRCQGDMLAEMDVTDFKRPVVDLAVEIFAVISDFPDPEMLHFVPVDEALLDLEDGVTCLL
jgi:hypothetical protein